jgi:hypothetical protein
VRRNSFALLSMIPVSSQICAAPNAGFERPALRAVHVALRGKDARAEELRERAAHERGLGVHVRVPQDFVCRS